MDEADRAQRHIDSGLAHSLRVRKPEGPAATGKCLNCDAPLLDAQRWCDVWCRDDWERLNAPRR